MLLHSVPRLQSHSVHVLQQRQQPHVRDQHVVLVYLVCLRLLNMSQESDYSRTHQGTDWPAGAARVRVRRRCHPVVFPSEARRRPRQLSVVRPRAPRARGDADMLETLAYAVPSSTKSRRRRTRMLTARNRVGHKKQMRVQYAPGLRTCGSHLQNPTRLYPKLDQGCLPRKTRARRRPWQTSTR